MLLLLVATHNRQDRNVPSIEIEILDTLNIIFDL